MKSSKRGKSTSKVKVYALTEHSVWLEVQEKEFFLSYEEYPWFKDCTFNQVANVELLHGHHLYWPDLDIDLDLESLDHPESYPLIWQA